MWFKVDDKLHSHRKARKAGIAMSLWVLAGSWSADHGTDGFIPDYIVTSFGLPTPRRLAASLVAAGLWKEDHREDDHGWTFHDWQERNPTKQDVEHARNSGAARTARWRERKRLAGQGELFPGGDASHGASRDASQGDGGDVTRDASPSRARVPDPTQPVTPTAPNGAAADAAALTITQRSKRITDAYAEAEPMCKWPAVNGIVIKAIKSERYSDDEIRDALLRLAHEGRAVTVETLRTELNGFPTDSQQRRSRSDDRVAETLALADRLEREEQRALVADGSLAIERGARR